MKKKTQTYMTGGSKERKKEGKHGKTARDGRCMAKKTRGREKRNQHTAETLRTQKREKSQKELDVRKKRETIKKNSITTSEMNCARGNSRLERKTGKNERGEEENLRGAPRATWGDKRPLGGGASDWQE